MKKWFKKIGQSFLRKDEVKDKEAISPTVEQKDIKDNKSSVYDYVKSVNQDCEITDFKRVALV